MVSSILMSLRALIIGFCYPRNKLLVVCNGITVLVTLFIQCYCHNAHLKQQQSMIFIRPHYSFQHKIKMFFSDLKYYYENIFIIIRIFFENYLHCFFAWAIQLWWLSSLKMYIFEMLIPVIHWSWCLYYCIWLCGHSFCLKQTNVEKNSILQVCCR